MAPPPQKDDVKIEIPGTALDHKNAGNELRGKKDVDGALNEYNLVLMIDPNFADALNNRAQEHARYIVVMLVQQTPELVYEVVQLFNLNLPQRAHEASDGVHFM